MKHYYLGCVAGLGLLVAGCAENRHPEDAEAALAVRIAPAVLSVLSGPDGLLLTNLDGLQCRATFTLPSEGRGGHQVSGVLAASKGRLAFESDGGGKKISGRFGVVWDTAANRGFLTSEDLQGVAPVTVTNRYQILQREAQPSAGAVEDGHPVQAAVVTLFSQDGQTVRRRVWESADFQALALRIEPVTEDGGASVSLSRVERAMPPEAVFSVADDFTRYPSTGALMSELVMRVRSVYSEAEFQGNLGPMLAPGEQPKTGSVPSSQQ